MGKKVILVTEKLLENLDALVKSAVKHKRGARRRAELWDIKKHPKLQIIYLKEQADLAYLIKYFQTILNRTK